MRQHSMQCPMALQRLVVVGLPATVEHGGGRSATSNSSAAVVAEITAAFITCLDSVRLNMLAVDQVLTLLPGCRSCLEYAMPVITLRSKRGCLMAVFSTDPCFAWSAMFYSLSCSNLYHIDLQCACRCCPASATASAQ
jgi:VPS28 protein